MHPSYQELERENRELRKENQRLRAQLKEAQARIAALEAELRRGRRQAAPFSRDDPKPDPKRPGRRPGQGRFTRREVPPEEEIQQTIEVPLPEIPSAWTTHRPGHPRARLAKRLRRKRKHLFTFLEVEGVEATNNRAERALRPAVMVRKTGGCNRTPRGARTHAVLASLLVTAKQQGMVPADYLA